MARKLLRQAWQEVQTKWPFKVNALCLLEDHLHCVITLPENDCNYALRWRLIKSKFSQLYRLEGLIENIPQSLSHVKRKELPVWQRRYWEHLIRDEDDYRRHVDYINFNPVKHGYVERAIDYLFSTFRHFVRSGFYTHVWGATGNVVKDMGDIGE
ncbi:transposase [bacterium]|nr:transposase [bacterium]